jgi:hypothetical protein
MGLRERRPDKNKPEEVAEYDAFMEEYFDAIAEVYVHIWAGARAKRAQKKQGVICRSGQLSEPVHPAEAGSLQRRCFLLQKRAAERTQKQARCFCGRGRLAEKRCFLLKKQAHCFCLAYSHPRQVREGLHGAFHPNP